MQKHILPSAALVVGLLGSIGAMAAQPTATKTTAPPGTQIVDSKGTVVGNFVGYENPSSAEPESASGPQPSLVSRQINGVWVVFEITPPGWSQSATGGLNT